MASPFLRASSATSLLVLVVACGGRVEVDRVAGGAAAAGVGGAVATTSASSTGTGVGLGPGQCRSVSDCMIEEECVAPGASPGCGICETKPTCVADADCVSQGALFICTTVWCSCSPRVCAQGCTSDSACAVGEACAPSHHCVPRACTTQADCPIDFDCNGLTCQRRSCIDDAVCSAFCVQNACYGMPGFCTVPPV